MRRVTLMFLVYAATALAGCSLTATLYPITGPMSKQSPVPVLHAQVNGVLSRTGTIVIKMPSGENCKGKWSVVSPMMVSSSSGSASASQSMSAAWTTVWGSGYTVGNVPGVNTGEAVVTGDRGTVIQVEFHVGSGTHHGVGVAKDNHGNIYKVLF